MKNNVIVRTAGGNKRIVWLLAAIIMLLAGTNIATFFFYPPTTGRLSAVSDQFTLLDPNRGTYQREDRIINFQLLRDYLNDTYEGDPNVSIYFEYLSTGANVAINKDAEFFQASLIKVPIAVAVAKKIERGEWKWTNELVLLPSDKSTAFGALHKKPSNSTFAIEELVRLSLAESDNTAHFILLRNLEVKEVEEVYDHMGLIDFLKTEGDLSAKRYSAIFRALYSSSY